MSADHGWPDAGPLDGDLAAVLRYFPLGGDLRLRRRIITTLAVARMWALASVCGTTRPSSAVATAV
jgi:hypothetical protein